MARGIGLSNEPETLDVKEFVSEKFLQNQLIDHLNRETDGLFWQNDSIGIKGRKRQNQYRPNGVPDILGILDGQAIGIEVKAPKGKMLQSQLDFSSRMKQAGGLYFVVRSMQDLTEIMKIQGW